MRANKSKDTMAGDLEAGTYESMTVPGPETTYVPSSSNNTTTTTTTTTATSPSSTTDKDEEEKEASFSCASCLNVFFSRLRLPTEDDFSNFGIYVFILIGFLIGVTIALMALMFVFWGFTGLLLNAINNLREVGGGGAAAATATEAATDAAEAAAAAAGGGGE